MSWARSCVAPAVSVCTVWLPSGTWSPHTPLEWTRPTSSYIRIWGRTAGCVHYWSVKVLCFIFSLENWGDVTTADYKHVLECYF